jgi:hypothetical protein
LRCDNNSMRWFVLILLLSIPASGQQTWSVDKLLQFITSSVEQKLPDKDVAAYLSGVKLSEKLEDRTIENLLGKGAGPRTVAALTRLADQSAKLTPPPKPVSTAPKPAPTGPPPPSSEEQERILREIKEYALGYIQSLPNFLCLQVTRRSVDMHAQPGGPYSWSPSDRIAEKLSFVDHKENYELITHNENAMFGKTWEAVGGALSRGDWASLLGEIFDPQTETDFHWARWGNLDGKLYHVYEYRIDQAHSRLTIEHEKQERVTPGYHGLIYVPATTVPATTVPATTVPAKTAPGTGSVIWRVTVEPDMPASFPIQDIHEVMKYNYSEISGQPYLLPIASEVTMRSGRIASRNEIDFKRYQKYTADTSIKFDDTEDPAPTDEPKKP